MTETGLQAEALDLDPAAVAPGRDLMSKFDALIAERKALIDTGITPIANVVEKAGRYN